MRDRLVFPRLVNANGRGPDRSAGCRPAGRYEYSPFGKTIYAAGDAGDVNPFRFSTKYTDAETGLAYFGYRYYNPETGRWLNRDPIGEEGGDNIHGYAHNEPITQADALGLDPKAKKLVEDHVHGIIQSYNDDKYLFKIAKHSGVYEFVYKLLMMVKDAPHKHFRFGNVDSPKYYALKNRMVLPKDGGGSLHETIHMHNDWSGLDPGEQQDEALAYGVIALMGKMTKFLAAAESVERLQCGEARRSWRVSWDTYNRIIHYRALLYGEWYDLGDQYYWDGGEKSAFFEEVDIWDINAKYGIRFSCEEISKVIDPDGICCLECTKECLGFDLKSPFK